MIVLFLTDKENRSIQVDYKKGFLFLLISNVFLLTSSSINKYIAHIGFDIPTYIFISGLAGTLYVAFTKKDAFDTVEKEKKLQEMKV